MKPQQGFTKRWICRVLTSTCDPAVANLTQYKSTGLWGKVALFATMFYRNITMTRLSVTPVYSECCGMPPLKMGLIDEVKDKALRITSELIDYINDGYRVVSLVPSCTLMMAHEWPLLHPDNPDIQCLRTHVMDVSAFSEPSKTSRHDRRTSPLEALAFTWPVTPEHKIRAQSRRTFVIDSETKVQTTERCSGHGGSWGLYKENFQMLWMSANPPWSAFWVRGTPLSPQNALWLPCT